MKQSKRELAHKKHLQKDSEKQAKRQANQKWMDAYLAKDHRRKYYYGLDEMIKQYVNHTRWGYAHSPIHFILKMESQYTNGRALAEQACDIVESPLYQAMNETLAVEQPFGGFVATSIDNGEWVVSSTVWGTSTSGTYITFTNGTTVTVKP